MVSSTKLFLGSCLATGLAACGFLSAQVPRMEDRVVEKKDARPPQTMITATESKLSMGIRVESSPTEDHRKFVLLSDGHLSLQFLVPSRRAPDTDAERIRSGDLTRLWGLPRGIAELASSWSALTAGQALRVTAWDVAEGVPSRIDAVAIFERDGRTTLWLMDQTEEQTVIHSISELAMAACNASPPGYSCGCSASGTGAVCEAWVDPSSGTAHARCSDNSGTTRCNGKGGSCKCQVE